MNLIKFVDSRINTPIVEIDTSHIEEKNWLSKFASNIVYNASNYLTVAPVTDAVV